MIFNLTIEAKNIYYSDLIEKSKKLCRLTF